MNKILYRSQLFVKRNSSTILTCIGGAGVVATGVMAIKATPKAILRIEEAKREKGEDLTKLETVQAAAPVYIPTVLVGASTIACIFGANVLNKRKQASLVSAYALLDNSYKEYTRKVEEMLGENANREVRNEIAKDHYDEEEVPDEDDGKQLFYDDLSKRYFRSTIEDVQRAEYRLNREIQMRGWFTLDEFYELLDIETIDGSEALGWAEGGNMARYWQSWVDFTHHKVTADDGLEFFVIETFQEPYMDWQGY